MNRVVCHLIASEFAGGPEKQIVEHCVRLPQRGWQAVVGSFRENRAHVEVIEAAHARGLPTFLIDTRSGFSPLAVRQLRRFLGDWKVAILITHGYKPNIVGWLAGRRCRWLQVPVVRGYTAATWRVRRYEEMDRWVLQRLPRVLCVSEGTGRILEGYGIRPERITVVHNAVDCDIAAHVHPRDLCAEFALPENAKVLVAAGRLSPEKGHAKLLEALQELRHRDPPVHLILCGSGAMEESLRRQAMAAGLNGRVIFAGFRRNILEYLAGADVVVNPSFTEGLPNVLLEAFSLGKPVVATNVGGTPELVHDGETGWLVPAGDAAALASAITRALDDAAHAQALGTQAREHVKARFSFEKQTEELTRVYAELTKDPHR